MSDDPWQGLVPGRVDARRVDRAGRHDFFWWVSPAGEPSLLLKVPDDLDESDRLPEIRQLWMRFGPVSDGRALLVGLRDQEQRDLFATLCRDVVAAAEGEPDLAAAVRRAVLRTRRWHHLLRGGGPDRLGKEEQRGLIGELDLLALLVGRLGARAAIEAWTGPIGAAKDFELGGLCVEVKARRGAAKPWVAISSQDQLADVADSRLVLRVANVDAAVKPQGMTLTDHVRQVEQLFKEVDLESFGLWELSLAATGYSHEHDYSTLRWTVGETRHFEVHDGFPRIVPPQAEGVDEVRYAIALASCAPFEMTEDAFLALVKESDDE